MDAVLAARSGNNERAGEHYPSPLGAPPTLRRQFDLPEEDVEALDVRGLRWETVLLTEVGQEAQAFWVFIHEFPLPKGYAGLSPTGTPVPLDKATVGIRVTGYPGGALDMAYFCPPLSRADGCTINNLGDMPLGGQTFQQWSRHYTPANPFRVGIDTIGTHLNLVEEWLLRELSR